MNMKSTQDQANEQANAPAVGDKPKHVYSLADFDHRGQANQGKELELRTPGGKLTGVFLHVLGDEADLVRETTLKHNHDLNMARNKAVVAGHIFDESRANYDWVIPSAMVRTIGWRGLSEPFTQENLRRLFQNSRDAAHQVLAFSVDTQVFTPALPES